jgi:hypothetical protein
MAKFLFIYRGAGKHYETMTPDELQAHHQRWADWLTGGMKKGWLVDPGDGLTKEGRVVATKVVTDGPFVESKEMIGGFSVVKAGSFDEAAELAKGCPGLKVGAVVEVREMAGMPEKLFGQSK